jgi:hypothetical protein
MLCLGIDTCQVAFGVSGKQDGRDALW